MKKINLDSNAFRKAITIVTAIAAGAAAVSNSLDQQKKDAEFKEMKTYIDTLKNKES